MADYVYLASRCNAAVVGDTVLFGEPSVNDKDCYQDKLVGDEHVAKGGPTRRTQGGRVGTPSASALWRSATTLFGGRPGTVERSALTSGPGGNLNVEFVLTSARSETQRANASLYPSLPTTEWRSKTSKWKKLPNEGCLA